MDDVQKSRLVAAGVLAVFLVNTALFTPPKFDLHDAATLAGSIVASLLVQGLLVGIVYGIYRLIRRGQQHMPFLEIALRTLVLLTLTRVITLILPAGRLAKVH